MLVRCTSISGANVPLKIRENIETDISLYSPFKIGERYVVYGIMFKSKRTEFLICAESCNPDWVPSVLFSVEDSMVPNWHLNFGSDNSEYAELFSFFDINALMGYEKLVSDFQHYAGIIERDDFHLGLFFNEKCLMDALYKT